LEVISTVLWPHFNFTSSSGATIKAIFLYSQKIHGANLSMAVFEAALWSSEARSPRLNRNEYSSVLLGACPGCAATYTALINNTGNTRFGTEPDSGPGSQP
jgi:hypothetical protein